MDIIIKIGIVGAVLAAIWWILQPKWSIRVVVDANGVRSQRGIASRRVSAVKDFFENNNRKIPSIKVVSPAFSSQRDFLIYQSIFSPSGAEVTCLPV